MSTTPSLTLVDPRSATRRAARQRLVGLLTGTVIIACSAIPFLLSLPS